MILYRDSFCVKQFVNNTSPSPHAIFIFISILHCTVSHRKQYRIPLFTGSPRNRIFFYRFQITRQFQPLIITDSFGCRFCIDTRAKSTCVNTVQIEHILYFFFAEFLKFACRDIIQINKRNSRFFSYLLRP